MRVLLTGGSGRLGNELKKLIPHISSPSSSTLDITDFEGTQALVLRTRPEIIVHAAAYTNVGEAEHQRNRCWEVNVQGTRNIVHAANAVNAKIVHISTDYVFNGETGNYRESDIPGPVVNFYSLSKLVAEEAVRKASRYLIIRTSFRPREFQYPVAFSDLYTGQDYVDVIAPLIAQVIEHALEVQEPILHVVTERKSVYELAKRRRADVREGRREESSVILPSDVSLNTELWQSIRKDWN